MHSGGCGRRRHILLCPPGAAPEVAAPSTREREMREAMQMEMAGARGPFQEATSVPFATFCGPRRPTRHSVGGRKPVEDRAVVAFRAAK